MTVFPKGISKLKKARILEDDGLELELYPTDSFGAPNSGDAASYYYKGGFFVVIKEADNQYHSGHKTIVSELSNEQASELRKDYEKDITEYKQNRRK